MVDFQSRDRSRRDDADDESSTAGDGPDERSDEKPTLADGDSHASGAEHDSGHTRDGDGRGNGHDHEDEHEHGGDHDSGHTHGGDDHDHHHHHDVETVSAAVVTISSSRTLENDPSGDAIVDALTEAGNEVATRELVNDDYDSVQGRLDALVSRGDVDVVVSTGGTGVTPDDVTVEAVRPLLDKRLPGFGELFRSLSYEEIGTRVVGTRAVAGIADGVPVFCLPGSEHAARLGTEAIVVEEVGHLVGLARRDEE